MKKIKIALLGLNGSGKLTFIRTIRTFPENDLWEVRYGEIDWTDGVCIYLYGIDLLATRNEAVEVLIRQMNGILLMVDSTDSTTLDAIKPYTRMYDLPLVIVANRQDHPLAHSVNAVRQTLETSLPVVPCVASNREAILSILHLLMQQISGD